MWVSTDITREVISVEQCLSEMSGKRADFETWNNEHMTWSVTRVYLNGTYSVRLVKLAKPRSQTTLPMWSSQAESGCSKPKGRDKQSERDSTVAERAQLHKTHANRKSTSKSRKHFHHFDSRWCKCSQHKHIKKHTANAHNTTKTFYLQRVSFLVVLWACVKLTKVFS